jgi:hypothetical protein
MLTDFGWLPATLSFEDWLVGNTGKVALHTDQFFADPFTFFVLFLGVISFNHMQEDSVETR